MSLDPRVKLLILVLINVVVFASPDLATEWLCMGVIAALLAWMGCWRQLVYGLLFYAGMMGALYLCGLTDNFLTAFMSMMIICFRKVIPTVFFASGLIATTKVGDLVSAMQSLRIPKVIVIPFTVTLRFFPTAKEEFAAIRDAARLRGLRFSMERTLVPMMMRCANIAEELSAASVTRGIESTRKRTSMRELRLGASDLGVAVVFSALTVFAVMGGLPLLMGGVPLLHA
ncbi:MAG: energy-coupling factor transporter transmembrane protein EcfT [Coriobacteriales bacterium]|jgi:energy-coupling factor transport system permease protein|nr:energy-coupling factor transporter transmembrane protein EcfT [Coriobacteriales bacterium]